MGIKTLRKLQIGKEGTKGNAVAATTIWRGMGVLNDEQELQFVEEDVGVLAQPDSAYIPQLLAGVSFDEVDCTFEQLPYILSAGVKKVESGSADTGSGYIYAYPMPMTAANDISTYTIEGGDDAGAEEVEYCYVSEFTLSGQAGEAVKMGATLQGRRASVSSFTGALSIPSTEIALFNLGKFYVGDSGTAFGSLTQRTQSLLGFEMNVTTGWIPRWTCDGQLYFVFLRSTRPEVTLSLTLEHDSFAIAEKVCARTVGGKLRKIRLLFEGSALGTPGTYSKKTIIVDLCGKYTTVPSMEDEDGDNVLTFEVAGVYSATDAAYLEFTVVNENSALT